MLPPNPDPLDIFVPDWAMEVFFTQHPEIADELIWRTSRHKALYGGRSGAKTETIGRALLIRLVMLKTWLMCGREFQSSIRDSVKSTFDELIYLYHLEQYFKLYKQTIECRFNGSLITFNGMNRNISNIKGWNHVDLFWGEEAEAFLPETLEILFPTLRESGSEYIFSWNRKNVQSAIDKYYLAEGVKLPRCIIRKVNYDENPFHPPEMEEERLACLANTPERYPHIWLGEIDEGAGDSKVLSYSDLRKCIDAHIKLGYTPSGMRHAGLDVADKESGGDTNSWAMRRGPLVEMVDEWTVKHLWMTASKADFRNRKHGVVRMYFDAVGMGAGIKSDLSRIPKNPEDGSGPQIKKFIPFFSHGKVMGGDRVYIKAGKERILNKDFFDRVNAQAWWNIKQRVQNTMMALEGEKVDLERCFFISSKITDLDKLLVELSQCVWDDSTGKIKVDKKPDGAPSPNKADSVVMAYVADLKKGLRA